METRSPSHSFDIDSGRDDAALLGGRSDSAAFRTGPPGGLPDNNFPDNNFPDNFPDDADDGSALASQPAAAYAKFSLEDASPADARPSLTKLQIVALNAFWFGFQLFWFILSIVVIPMHIRQIVGDEHKGEGLGLISLESGLANLPVSMLVGTLNDRFSSRAGKRMPWMVGGVVWMCVSLAGMTENSSLLVYSVSYLSLTMAAATASVPFNGLIADHSGPEQKGLVSAIMGSLNLAGYFVGAIIGVFSDTLGTLGMYLIIVGILALSTLATWSVGEPNRNFSPSTRLVPCGWYSLLVDMVSPLKNANFRLVFASRFMFQMGIATVQQFLQYWIGDCVSVDMSPSRAVSIALIPLLTLSPLGALAIPKSRRKVVVYAAAALMALSCVLMIVTTYFYAALAVSGIFGLGYGPFLSVEFAMLMDVLPSKDDAARDISLWHTALVLPQIVASPIAGWVRDGFQPLGTQWDVQCLGYKVMFSVCLLYFLAGVGITRRIAGIH